MRQDSGATAPYNNDALLDPAQQDNMATDWSQWMQWDDFDRLSPSATVLGNANGNGNGNPNPNSNPNASANINNGNLTAMPNTTTAAASANPTPNPNDIDIGLQLNDIDMKPGIDTFDAQNFDNVLRNMNNGLLPPFNPIDSSAAAAAREFGSFSSEMVTPFAPAYSPQYANLKRHSIAVPAFPQHHHHQMNNFQMMNQNLALRSNGNPNPNAAAFDMSGPNGLSALQQHPQQQQPQLNGPMQHLSKSSLHPQNMAAPSSMASRKRKSAADVPSLPGGTLDGNTANPMRSSSPPQKALPSKKRSHNVIEKRYRANLNEKIAELRDAVPSLRIMARQRSRAGVPGSPHSDPHDVDGDDDIVGGTGSKLNKASILSKATEYIRHLESRNKRLDEENVELKNRLRQLEKVAEQSFIGVASTPHGTYSGRNSLAVNGNLHSGSSPGSYMSTDSASGGSPMFSHAEQTDEFSPEGSPNPLYPPEGLIKVPDYLKSMRPTGPQAHYADDYRNSQPSSNVVSRHHSPAASNTGSSDGSSGPNRFMLGTLAALMIVGIDESYRDPEDPNDKGLIGVPIDYFRYGVRTMNSWLRASFNVGNGFTQGRMQSLFGVLVSSAAVFGCAIVVFLYLFSGSRRRGGEKVPQVTVNGGDTEANQISSPTQQQVWLSKIQSLWVSGHTVVPEWYAVMCRMLEYVVRCCLGSSVYSTLTGITDEDEKTRVKSWDAAVDTQLTGGDPQVSRSRLILTAFAAGTLPQSPARMMLKALHVRTILWRSGPEDSRIGKMLHDAAIKIASYQWEEARKLHASLPLKHKDRLPRHLALLLQHSSEVVLTDSIVQRAVNVVFNRPTQEATPGDDAMLDMVADDASIRSPLDYLASWWSCGRLQETLLTAWENIEEQSDAEEEDIAANEHMTSIFEKKLNEALAIAPPTSMASIMARVMKAIFVDEDRVANINSVLTILSKPSQPNKQQQQRQERSTKSKVAPSLNSLYDMTSPVPSCVRVDLRLAVRAAMIIAILRRQVIQHAGQLIGIRGRVQLGGSTCSGRDPRLTVAGAMKAFNNLPVDAVELGLAGCASLWWALRVVAREEEEAKKADAAANCGRSSTSGSSGGSTLREHSPDRPSPFGTEQMANGDDLSTSLNALSSPTRRRASSASSSSVESIVSLTRTTTSASSDECITPNPELADGAGLIQRYESHQQYQFEAEQEQLDNTIPSPDLRRIATHLAYWARHAYNPISYGFTPQLNERVVNECYAICDSADQVGRKPRGRKVGKEQEQEQQQQQQEEVVPSQSENMGGRREGAVEEC